MTRDRYYIPEMRLEPLPEPEGPRCPCCGQECDTVYFNFSGTAVGCEYCVTKADAWEAPECQVGGARR